MRIVLALEYEGTPFHGWQSQPDGRGVQDALERALCAIGGMGIRTHAAGRTDAGVHASSQIAHFDTEIARPDSAWVRGASAHLPREMSVLWARQVADDFHARFAASARHYTYLLLTRPQRPALLAGRAGWYHRPLDVAAMREGAAHLAGMHDFSAFRAAECQAKSPVKSLAPVAIEQTGALIRFDFCANAFLHHMIRNIVGTLVYIGAGKHDPRWAGELLAGGDRTQAAPTFAADGLYFTGADYDARFGLPPTVRAVTLPAA